MRLSRLELDDAAKQKPLPEVEHLNYAGVHRDAFVSSCIVSLKSHQF